MTDHKLIELTEAEDGYEKYRGPTYLWDVAELILEQENAGNWELKDQIGLASKLESVVAHWFERTEY